MISENLTSFYINNIVNYINVRDAAVTAESLNNYIIAFNKQK